MNKDGERVNRVQLKESERCLRDFQKGKLAPMTFDDCVTADRKNNVQKAKQNTIDRESRKCGSLDVPPPFAYTSAVTVNAAAVDGALALTYEIFGGPPVLDANLVTNADDKDTAKCQTEMLKRANKVEKAALKEINKAKRPALKDETVTSAAALEEKLQAVLSSNKRIDKIEATLLKMVDRKCGGLDAAPNTIFGGSCGEGTSLLEVEECVIAAARCGACLKINAFDGLNLDCDLADDHDHNWSCPALADDDDDEDAEGGSQTGFTNSDCLPRTAPEGATQIQQQCVGLANSAPNAPFTKQDYQFMPPECQSLVNPICR